MARRKRDFAEFSDRDLVETHRLSGGYEFGARWISEQLGKTMPRSTYYDEMSERGLTDKVGLPLEDFDEVAPAEKSAKAPLPENFSISADHISSGAIPTPGGSPEKFARPVIRHEEYEPTSWVHGGSTGINYALEEAARLSNYYSAPKLEVSYEEEEQWSSVEDALQEQCKKLTSQLKRYEKRDRLEQRIVDSMREKLGKISLPSERFKVGNTDYRFIGEAFRENTGEDEHVLLLSDAHYSEVVTPSDTNGMEDYDPGVFEDRMLRLYNQLAAKQNTLATPISRLHVFYLGDMQSGDIHEELSVTNAMPQGEAIVEGSRFSIGWHQMLESIYEEQHITGVSGNHPRFSKKPFNKQGWNTGDWIYYETIKMHLEDEEGYHFDIPKGNHHDVILPGGWRALLLHGHGVKSYGTNGPEGAVVRRVKELQDQYQYAKRPLDYVMLGHWHRATALSITGAKAFINGSIKGIDEYGMNNYGNGTEAEQLLLTVNPAEGVTDVSYLNLNKTRTPQRKRELV